MSGTISHSPVSIILHLFISWAYVESEQSNHKRTTMDKECSNSVGSKLNGITIVTSIFLFPPMCFKTISFSNIFLTKIRFYYIFIYTKSLFLLCKRRCTKDTQGKYISTVYLHTMKNIFIVHFFTSSGLLIVLYNTIKICFYFIIFYEKVVNNLYIYNFSFNYLIMI